MYFDVPDLLNPSPQFSLGSIIYPLNAGFSEALDFTKIIWNYLLSALHDCKTSSATQSCLLLFFCSVSGLVKAVLHLRKHSLENSQGTACQCTQYSSAYFQRVNTHSFACIDYHQNERQIVLLLHCFPTRLNQFQAVFSHSYFELLRVLNRIFYPNIMKEKNISLLLFTYWSIVCV